MFGRRSGYFALVLSLVGFGLNACGNPEMAGDLAGTTGSGSGGSSKYDGEAMESFDAPPAEGGSDESAAAEPMMSESAGGDTEGAVEAPELIEEEEVEEQVVLQAGQLTAGEWDDNLNFERYQQYISDYLQSMPDMPTIPSGDRVIVRVVDAEGTPVSNANVTISSGDETLLNAPTASDGRVLFLPGHDGADAEDTLSIEIESELGAGTLSADFVVEDGVATFVLEDVAAELPDALDLAFVVDATGSMGDELEYLKAEIDYIAQSIEADHPNLPMRFALVVYRDIGDKYVTKTADFTSDLDDFRATLEKQSANGGGDYPEAMDKALADMNALSWNDGNTARVAFLVADAPPHRKDAGDFLKEVDSSRRQGIKLYTVAASGVADEAEYLMRVASQATLARYLFLTDDSGIGNAHAEPHIPCYHVQLLSDLTVRMVLSELSGAYVAPESDSIVRTVGTVQDGVCTLADDSPAYLWLSE